MRLPKDQYVALKKFKKKVNEERSGSLVRDHSGHLYEVTSDGSIRRCGRDDLIKKSREDPPGLLDSRNNT